MKRLFDLCVVVASAGFWAPVLVVVAVTVRLKLGPPVLFRQIRPGFRARSFALLKFRTMTNARDGDGKLLPDADRLTPFGRWLRSTSLDELPQVLNILKGEMSLVGPRPLLTEYLQRYTPDQARRHEVRPGLTGWTQVCGRNALSWEEKFALDLWYVDHRTFLLDLKILGLTLLRVLTREGVNAPGDATMPEFLGSSASQPSGNSRGSVDTTPPLRLS